MAVDKHFKFRYMKYCYYKIYLALQVQTLFYFSLVRKVTFDLYWWELFTAVLFNSCNLIGCSYHIMSVNRFLLVIMERMFFCLLMRSQERLLHNHNAYNYFTNRVLPRIAFLNNKHVWVITFMSNNKSLVILTSTAIINSWYFRD